MIEKVIFNSQTIQNRLGNNNEFRHTKRSRFKALHKEVCTYKACILKLDKINNHKIILIVSIYVQNISIWYLFLKGGFSYELLYGKSYSYNKPCHNLFSNLQN